MKGISVCFFGFGICPSNTLTAQNIVRAQTEVLNEIVTEKITANIASHSVNIMNSTAINVTGDNVVLDGIAVGQYAKLDADSALEIDTVIKSDTTANTIIDQLIRKSDEISQIDTSILSSSGNNLNSDSRTELTKKVKSQFKELIKQENISGCVMSVVNALSIEVKATGDVTIKALRVDQSAEAISKCVIKSIMNVFSKIDYTVEVKEEVTQNTKVKQETGFPAWAIVLIIIAIVAAVGLVIMIIVGAVMIIVARKHSGAPLINTSMTFQGTPEPGNIKDGVPTPDPAPAPAPAPAPQPIKQ